MNNEKTNPAKMAGLCGYNADVSIRPEDIPAPEETQAVREAAAVKPRRKRRWWRWPVRLAVGGALLLLVAVVLLPTLLSTGPGTSWLIGKVNQSIPGKLEVDDLRLGWFRGQQLRGVRLLDPMGHEVATLGNVELQDMGLIALLRGSSDWGMVLIENGDVGLVRDEEGRANLDRALGTSFLSSKPNREASAKPKPQSTPAKKKKRDGVLPADLSLRFALRDLRVGLTGPGIEPVELELPEATLTADGPGKLGVTLEATVAQGDNVGRSKFVGTVKGLFDAAGRLTLSGAEFDVEGAIENLPLVAIDRLLADRRGLELLVGPTLDAEVSLQGTTAELDGLVLVTSEHLNVRQALTAEAGRLTVADESPSTWRVMPAAWSRWAGEDAAALAEPFVLNFTVTELDAPRDGQVLDWAQTRVALTLDLAEGDAVALDVPGKGRVRISDVLASVVSPAADRRYAFALTGAVDAYGKAGQLVAAADVQRGETGWDTATAAAELRELPLPVIDALLGQGSRLTATFGQTLGMDVNAVADGDGGYSLTADLAQSGATADVSTLSGRLTGSYAEGGVLALKTDEPIRLTLTPEAFEQWMQPVAEVAEVGGGETVGLSLAAPTQINADVDLRFAMHEEAGNADGEGLRLDPRQTRLKLDVTLPETQLVDEWYGRAIPLRNGTVRVDSRDLREPIVAEVEFETDSGEGTGRLDADVTLTGMMLDDGYVQVENGKLTATVELTKVPTAVFDALTRQQGYAVAAFGDQISATLTSNQWSNAAGGELGFEMQSANGSLASIKGRDVDGNFVPDGPMTLFLNQTPELSNKIMRFLNPVLMPAVVSASVPMAITIDDDNFTLPTRGFDLSKVNADVQVQMGTVSIVPNISPIDKILPQLQALGLIERSSIYEAQVSPIELKIRNGVIGYDRLTFKIDDVDLEFGGIISLVDQSVDMKLTLGGREIEREAWLKTIADRGFRIGGKVGDLKSNFSLSREQLPGTIGDLLGDLLRKELEDDKDEAAPDASTAPPAEDDGEPQADDLGGLLGDLLNRELRRAQEKRQREREEEQRRRQESSE